MPNHDPKPGEDCFDQLTKLTKRAEKGQPLTDKDIHFLCDMEDLLLTSFTQLSYIITILQEGEDHS